MRIVSHISAELAYATMCMCACSASDSCLVKRHGNNSDRVTHYSHNNPQGLTIPYCHNDCPALNLSGNGLLCGVCKQARFRGAESDPNPNRPRQLARRGRSEPGPAKPIRIRAESELGRTEADPNPNPPGRNRTESELRKINPNPGLEHGHGSNLYQSRVQVQRVQRHKGLHIVPRPKAMPSTSSPSMGAPALSSHVL